MKPAELQPAEAPKFVESAARHFIIRPPKHCPRYRRWRVWYDFGHFEHGIVYRASKWRGLSPSGHLLEHPEPATVGSWPWLKAEIDREEDEKAQSKKGTAGPN